MLCVGNNTLRITSSERIVIFCLHRVEKYLFTWAMLLRDVTYTLSRTRAKNENEKANFFLS